MSTRHATSDAPDDRTDEASVEAAARALRIAAAHFAGIVSIASDAIISVDEDQRIVLFNQGAEEIFGWSAAEVLGRSLDVLLPQRFRAVHREHIRHFAATPVASRRMGERQEISGLRRSGQEFPAEASISKLDVDGSRIFTVLLRDATERRRVERGQQFLSRAGQLLATSLDVPTTLQHAADLGVEFLADCCIIYDAVGPTGIPKLEARAADPSNRPLMDELRHTPLNARGPHPAVAVLDTGVAEFLPDVTDAYLAAHAEDEPSLRLFREIHVRSAMVVPLVARDQIIGAIGLYACTEGRRYDEDDLALAHELANRVALALDNARLYREAQDALQARDDVLAVVSHDLGNPLAAIRVGTSLLLRAVPPEQRGQGGWQHLEGIRQSAAQMERLVNDLLDVKRIEAGLLPLHAERQSVEVFVRETLELFSALAEEKDIRLRAVIDAPGAVVRCDRDRTLQIFSNLVGNAIRFTPAGGEVEIRAEAKPGEVQFTVADTGRGIPPENLPHVFDRFWQAHRSNREGIGLGLAIVKSIVLAHGGRIWVESEPAVGSRFYFTLPGDTG
jgi:PAS domain S-box-containing protein